MSNIESDENLYAGLERKLIAVIEADGAYALDWQETDRGLTETEAAFQQHLYQLYLDDADSTLFELGTTKKTGELSESLDFLYRVATAFVKDLTRNPDLETLREKAVAVLQDEEREALLAAAPYLNGAEFLNAHWLEFAWDRLNRAFSNEIQKYPGSVTEYFIGKNPELHFAGKVYFHLVESKQQEFPFAFLATYAAEASTTGKARHLPGQGDNR